MNKLWEGDLRYFGGDSAYGRLFGRLFDPLSGKECGSCISVLLSGREWPLGQRNLVRRRCDLVDEVLWHCQRSGWEVCIDLLREGDASTGADVTGVEPPDEFDRQAPMAGESTGLGPCVALAWEDFGIGMARWEALSEMPDPFTSMEGDETGSFSDRRIMSLFDESGHDQRLFASMKVYLEAAGLTIRASLTTGRVTVSTGAWGGRGLIVSLLLYSRHKKLCPSCEGVESTELFLGSKMSWIDRHRVRRLAYTIGPPTCEESNEDCAVDCARIESEFVARRAEFDDRVSLRDIVMRLVIDDEVRSVDDSCCVSLWTILCARTEPIVRSVDSDLCERGPITLPYGEWGYLSSDTVDLRELVLVYDTGYESDNVLAELIATGSWSGTRLRGVLLEPILGRGVIPIPWILFSLSENGSIVTVLMGCLLRCGCTNGYGRDAAIHQRSLAFDAPELVGWMHDVGLGGLVKVRRGLE
ncbi:hypothetical protein Tco_0959509 [Tanacetum coccineum]